MKSFDAEKTAALLATVAFLFSPTNMFVRPGLD
jgi:hypothetical protein